MAGRELDSISMKESGRGGAHTTDPSPPAQSARPTSIAGSSSGPSSPVRVITNENAAVAAAAALVGETALAFLRNDTNTSFLRSPMSTESSEGEGSGSGPRSLPAQSPSSPAEGQQRQGQTVTDARGVSRHRYSGARVKDLLRKDGWREDSDDDDDWEEVRRRPTGTSNPRSSRRREAARTAAMTRRRRSDGRRDDSSYDDDDDEGEGDGESLALGLLQGAKNWWYGQKEKQQRENLARQVEEQRRRLQEEARRGSGGRRRSSDGSSGAVGLNANPTFRQAAAPGGADGSGGSAAPLPARGARLCGVGSSDSIETVSSADSRSLEGEAADGVERRRKKYGGHPEGMRVGAPTATRSGAGMSVSVEIEDNDDNEDNDDDNLNPDIIVEKEPPSKYPFVPYILTSEQMKNIASSALPSSLLFSHWRRLYSLARDGDSFDAFLRRVQGHSRTLLVIRTTRGAVFGGYADSPWEAQHYHLQGGTFYGSAQASLFKVAGSGGDARGDGDGDVRVYKWTGANRYIQVCDVNSKMIAFGGGGEAGAFGLCVEDDFRRGSTGHCATFDNESLCDEDYFDIVDVEVWGFSTGVF